MCHSDDNGLVLPPKLAPYQVVIIPIYRNEEQLNQIDAKVAELVAKLRGLGVSVKYDNSDNKKPGWKFAEYELKGFPFGWLSAPATWRTARLKLPAATP